MTQPNSGFGETQASRAAAPAASPNPKIQAVGFAIQLAGVNATCKPQAEVTAQELVADAEVIATFIGRSS